MLPVVPSIADLQREFEDRQRRDYRRLQRAALTKLCEQSTGKPAQSWAEVQAWIGPRFAGAIDPLRHLSEAECARILSTATGTTATG